MPTGELEQLARLAARGDEAAFEALVVATTPELYALARRLAGNEHDARDIVQEAYLRAFRAIGTFRGDAAVRTWLYRITANCASTFLSRSRRRHGEVDLEHAAEVIDDHADRLPEEVLARGSERERLTAAIDRLPGALRAVAVLHDVYGLGHEAIGEELRISVAASKVRLHRARRRLREELEVERRQVPQRRRARPAVSVAESARVAS
jgi:RNA polymerase sigma-70 factor, ECF subfamily